MRTPVVVFAVGLFLVGAADVVSGGQGGSGGGSPPDYWREASYYRGVLHGDRTWTLTQIFQTNVTPERAFWRSGGPSGDWVQILADSNRAAFLVRGGAHTTRTDWDAFAVFGLRDDEDLASTEMFGVGSSIGEQRTRLACQVPALRTVSGAGAAKRPLETWMGDIDRSLLGSTARQDANAVRMYGQRRASAVSTVARSGPGRWTYTWTLENGTAGDLDFSWPSVLTDDGEAFEGTLPPGGTAVLERTLDRPPFVFAGPVKFFAPGGAHPDYQAAAEHYSPRP